MNVGTTEGFYASTVETQTKWEIQLQHRVDILWARLRAALQVVIRLSWLKKDIQLFGTQPHYWTMVQETKQRPKDDYLFRPDSFFSQVWVCVLWPFLIWTAIGLPFSVSFQTDNSWQLETTIDCLVFLNMLFIVNSIYVKSNYKIVTSRKDIVMIYIKSWFIIDVAAVIPNEFWEWTIIDPEGSWCDLLKFLKLFRLFLLYRYSGILQNISFLSRWLNEKKTTKRKSGMDKFMTIFRIFKILVTYFIVVHIIGCFWHLLGRLQISNYESWMNRYAMTDDSIFSQYITSIYFVFTTLTTVGYGDFVAKTKIEKVFAISLMAFGSTFYSYAISIWMSKLKTIDKRSFLIDTRLKSLNELSKDINLPDDVKIKAKHTIIENFKEYLSEDIDEATMLSELPSSLKAEVTLYLYKRVIDNIYFFNLRNPSFLSAIVPKLKSMTGNRSEYVYREGEIADEMYFLKKGRVLFRASNGVAFRTMADGSYFGEHELIINSTRLFSIEISIISTFLVLSKRDFITVMNEFPDIYEEIKEIDQARSSKFSVSLAHSLNLIPNTKLPPHHDLESYSISASEKDEESVHRLFRADTGIMVASMQFSADKFKNLSLWSHVLSNNNRRGSHRSSTVCADDGDEGIKMMRRRKKSILTSVPRINGNEEGMRHRSATLDFRSISPIRLPLSFNETKYFEPGSQRELKIPATNRTQATKISASDNWIYDESTLSELLGYELTDENSDRGNDSGILIKLNHSTKKINEDQKIIQDSIFEIENQQIGIMRSLDYIEDLIRNY